MNNKETEKQPNDKKYAVAGAVLGVVAGLYAISTAVVTGISALDIKLHTAGIKKRSLESMAQLDKSDPRFAFHTASVVGENAAWEEKLQDIVKDTIGNRKKWDFIPRQGYRHDLADVMHRANLRILPHTQEEQATLLAFENGRSCLLADFSRSSHEIADHTRVALDIYQEKVATDYNAAGIIKISGNGEHVAFTANTRVKDLCPTSRRFL